ncbi:hypothetical protein AAZX31_07G230500 [Glycine max]
MRGVLEGHAARGVVGEVARTRRVVLGSGLSCTLVAVVSVFPDAGGEGDDVGGALHEGLAGVKDLVLVEAEAVAARVLIGTFVRWVLHDVLRVVSDELEHCARPKVSSFLFLLLLGFTPQLGFIDSTQNRVEMNRRRTSKRVLRPKLKNTGLVNISPL